MRLRIGEHLQPVLDAAQEAIRVGQRGARLGGDVAGIDQCLQRRQQAAFAQRGFAAAADQLQCLHQEFDLADAPWSALDVVGQLLARDFGTDGGLHRTQAIEGAVVEVAPVHEWPQRFEEALAGRKVAGDRACLLPGIALPVAAFVLEVLLHRGERPRHATGIAVGAQAQVDAMAEAIGGDFVEELRQLLAEARVVGLRRQRTRPIRLAIAFVGVDEVDVGAEVQLAAAELAQPVNDQPLWRAVLVADDAVALLEFAFERGQRALQAGFGQLGRAGEGVAHFVQPQHIAPHQPRRSGRAIAAQQRRPLAAVLGRELRRRQRGRIGQQQRQQFRLSQQRVDGEVAGECDAPHALDCFGIVKHRGAGRNGAQALQRARASGKGEGVLHRRDSGTPKANGRPEAAACLQQVRWISTSRRSPH